MDRDLFTRGGPDVPDDRGMSMVAKHREQMQTAKESRALSKLAILIPQLGPGVHALALEECGWDEERAVSLLRAFQAARPDQLAALAKERKRRSKEQERRSKSADSSGSSDDGSSEDDDDSESDEDRKRKRRNSSSGKHYRRDKDDKKKKKKKRTSRDKKGKKRKRDRGDVYGKYGVLRETDLYSKRPEFSLWAMEIKNIDIENMPKYEEKQLFKDYMEDYNTATLAHKKYYDLERYEQSKAGKRSREAGNAKSMQHIAYNDEVERKKEIEAARNAEHAERLKAAYDELKKQGGGAKAEDMKAQQMLRAQMDLAYRTGDKETAQKIAARLAPDPDK